MPVGGLIALLLASMQHRKINQWRPLPEVWKSLHAILANTFFCSFFETDCSFKHSVNFQWNTLSVNSLAGYAQVCLVWGTGRSSSPQYSVKNLSLSSINEQTNNFVSDTWQQETHILNNTSLTIFLYCFANIPL